MKTRTNIHAGAGEPEMAGGFDPLKACKKEKDYWMFQAQKMEAIANCTKPTYPQPPYYPQPSPTPPAPVGGGWVGGVWFPDKSGVCG